MSEDDDDRTVTIPIHQSGDEVIRYAEVDADWWEYNTRANAVFEDLLEKYVRQPGVESVELVCDDEKHSFVDRYKQKIVISVAESDEAPSPQSIANDVPDEVDGIPVEVTTTRE